jgi:hypothetical protein
MKLNLLIFIFFLKCFDLKSQDSLAFPSSRKWVKTEFYVYEPAEDDLSDEKYTSNYAREMYNTFKKVHGWQDEIPWNKVRQYCKDVYY